jgi:putative tricarboxylic transport membrane protein
LTSHIRNPKDFWAGVLYAGFGVSAVVIGTDYELGSALRMGPAFFPTVLGALLGLIGAISLVRAFVLPGEAVGRLALKPLALIAVGILAFGFLARGAGLVVAIPLLVIVSATASIHFRWWVAVLVAAGMTAFCVLVFSKGLGVPLPVLGPWFGD